jgi:hypothetical protein
MVFFLFYKEVVIIYKVYVEEQDKIWTKTFINLYELNKFKNKVNRGSKLRIIGTTKTNE